MQIGHTSVAVIGNETQHSWVQTHLAQQSQIVLTSVAGGAPNVILYFYDRLQPVSVLKQPYILLSDSAETQQEIPQHLQLNAADNLIAPHVTAHWLAHTIQRIAEHNTQADETNIISGMLRALNSSTTLLPTLPAVAKSLAALVACDRMVFMQFDEHGGAIKTFECKPGEAFAHAGIETDSASFSGFASLLGGQLCPIERLATEQGTFEQALVEQGFTSAMFVPLRIEENSRGALCLLWHDVYPVHTISHTTLMRIGDAVALATERSRLYVEVEGNLRTTQALYRSAESLISLDNLDDVLQTILLNAYQAIDAISCCTIITFDVDKQIVLDNISIGSEIHVSHDIPFDELMDGLTGWVTRKHRVAFSPRGTEDLREKPYVRAKRKQLEVGSLIVAPLMYQEQVLGTLTVIKGASEPDFVETDIALYSAIANQASIAIKTAQLFHESRHRAHELTVIAELSADMRQAATKRGLLEAVLVHALRLVEGSVGLVMLPDEASDEWISELTLPIELPLKELRYPLDKGFAGRVMKTKEIHVSEQYASDPYSYTTRNSREKLKEVVSVIVIPFLAQDEVIGVMQLATKYHTTFSTEMRILKTMSEIVGNALRRIRLKEDLEHQIDESSLDLVKKNHELAEANERLQELDRLKSKFVSDVSHELRTPVTAMGLHLDLLKYGKPEKQARYLATIEREVARLKQLVTDVLKLSRFDLGRVQVAFASVDLNAIVAHEIGLHRENAENKGLSLQFDPVDDLPALWGEATQLAEMVGYLISNAVLYTKTGHIVVQIGYKEDGDKLTLRVEDTGMGICEEDIGQIFGRFYRGSNSHSIPGSGLGLNLVQEIVNLHGGTIEVHSEVGAGTTFVIQLPRDSKEQKTAAQKLPAVTS